MSGPRRRQMAVRTPDPNQVRQRQIGLAAVLIGVLAALSLIGLVVVGGFFGPSASASPTPTSVAVGSSTPSAPASGSPTAHPSAASPVPTPSSNSAPPSDLPSPTATSSELGDAIGREATFSLLGIDDLIAPEAIPRRITFNVEGKGDIHVDLTDVTAGTVRMCLYQGDASIEPPAEDCIVTEEGSLVATPTAAGPWTIWLYGDHPGRSPAATLRIRWAANNASLQLADFRFQGTDSPNYTGFRVRVTPVADGELHLVSAWDDGQGGDYPYLIVLTDLDGSGEPPIVEGDGDHAEAARAVVAGNNYEAAIDNTQESVIDQVLLRSTLTWP
jgi:hypothetical protein